MLYPDRELQELYISNQSIWEEVWEGDLSILEALDYMPVEEGSSLWEDAKYALETKTTPL